MKEDYCSFELSKLLKEKGFDGMCDQYFFVDYKDEISVHTGHGNWNAEKGYISIPTTGLAMKWLREVHKLHIDIDPSEGDWSPCVIELEDWSSLTGGEIAIQDTYEEAVEAAIKYSLENLI